MIQKSKWKFLRDLKKFRSSDPAIINGKWLDEDMVKTWTEDFIDDDTKQIISIERKELIKEKGTQLIGDEMSSVLFYLQCGDVDDVCVCSEQVHVYRFNPVFRYMYEIIISTTTGRYLYLLHANTVENAIVVLENWLAFYSDFDDGIGYSVVSIKRVNFVSNEVDPFADDDHDAENEEDDDSAPSELYYKAIVKRSWIDFTTNKPKSSCHVVIEKSSDVGQAKVLALDFAKDNFELENVECRYTVVSAQPYKVKAVVPEEYSKELLNIS